MARGSRTCISMGLFPALIEASVTCFGRQRLKIISLSSVVEFFLLRDIDQPLAIYGPRVRNQNSRGICLYPTQSYTPPAARPNMPTLSCGEASGRPASGSTRGRRQIPFPGWESDSGCSELPAGHQGWANGNSGTSGRRGVGVVRGGRLVARGDGMAGCEW